MGAILGDGTKAGVGRFANATARVFTRVFANQSIKRFNQAVFGVKLTRENDRHQGGASAPDKSRFEKPEIAPFGATAVYAHFGWKLQKIFPLPSGSSEPDNIRILLRKINAKLDNPPISGAG